MKSILILAFLALGCVDLDYSYDLDEYELAVPDGGVFLTVDGEPWRGEYDSRNQPQDGYCGPVAFKNIMWWHDSDVPWNIAAIELKTDDWDPGMKLWKYCAAACHGEIAVCANICYETVRKQVKGTSTKNIVKALTKNAPEGYSLEFTAEDPSAIDDIIEQIGNGNPVIVIETINDGQLHASVLTGFTWIDGEIWTVTANSYDRTIDDFMRGWSTIDSGSKIKRKAMYDFGIRPFIAMWYSSDSPPDPDSEF
jgi:hypothetical protein